MTDRELLELAAKAAGYPTNHPWNAERLLLEPPVIGLCIMGIATNWNPLTDDGDALRLAVKLGLLFKYMIDRYELFMRFYCEELDNDLKPSEATRRAIVRAAAEIGKELS